MKLHSRYGEELVTKRCFVYMIYLPTTSDCRHPIAPALSAAAHLLDSPYNQRVCSSSDGSADWRRLLQSFSMQDNLTVQNHPDSSALWFLYLSCCG